MSTPNDLSKSPKGTSSEALLDGSEQRDTTKMLVGFLIIASPLATIPGIQLWAGVIHDATGVQLGLVHVLLDIAAIMAVLAGIRFVIVARRRQRIRHCRARPMDFWKEALRAEGEQSYLEAVRLYSELAKRYPSSEWAEDAMSSIDLLQKEGKA